MPRCSQCKAAALPYELSPTENFLNKSIFCQFADNPNICPNPLILGSDFFEIDHPFYFDFELKIVQKLKIGQFWLIGRQALLTKMAWNVEPQILRFLDFIIGLVLYKTALNVGPQMLNLAIF